MVVRIFLLLQTILSFRMLTEVAAAGNHRCYVCVPNSGSSISDVLQTFPEGTVIPLCNQFDTDKPEFVRECPSPSYQGCLTQTNGSHVTKTCTEVGIEDCKTANKIKYCYCKGDLCNREPVPTEAPAPPEISTDDDEDSPMEGSGYFEVSDSSQMETSSETYSGSDIYPDSTEAPRTTKSAAPLTAAANSLYVLSPLIVLRPTVHRWNF